MGETEAHLARALHRVLRGVRLAPNSCPGPRTQVATLSSLSGESLPWARAPFVLSTLTGQKVGSQTWGPEGTGGNPGVQLRGGDQKLEPEKCCLPRGGDRMSEVGAAGQTPLPRGENKRSKSLCLCSWLSPPWDGAVSPDALLGQQAASAEFPQWGLWEGLHGLCGAGRHGGVGGGGTGVRFPPGRHRLAGQPAHTADGREIARVVLTASGFRVPAQR